MKISLIQRSPKNCTWIHPNDRKFREYLIVKKDAIHLPWVLLVKVETRLLAAVWLRTTDSWTIFFVREKSEERTISYLEGKGLSICYWQSMIKKEPSKANITNTRFFQQNISLMAAGIPDLLSAHHVLLRYAINIPKRAHQEVQNYKQPVSFVCHTRVLR